MILHSQWLVASEALRQAKEEELRVRNLICEEVLGDKVEGSVTKRENGLKVTATAKVTRSLDREVLEVLWEDITDEERECIDYKPSLRLALYKKIEAEGGKLMEAVTVKPAQASLKIKEENL